MRAPTTSSHGRRATRALATLITAALVLGLSASPSSSANAFVRGDARPTPKAATRDLEPSSQPVARMKGVKKFRVGVSAGFSILDATDAQLARDLRRTKALGAKQLRLDISWEQIEPEPGVFNWEKTDRVFTAAKDAGINVLAVIGFAPVWGEKEDGSVRVDKFTEFVELAAKRYRYKVAAWELWNEPNQARSWIANPVPADYARLVNSVGPVIRKYEPKARIMMGSLAPAVDDPDGEEISPITFLKRLYKAGINRSAYDSFSVHPFSYPAFPSGDEEWNTFNRLPDIYKVLKKNGDGAKPMWLTEYGARTGTTSRSVSLKRHKKLMVDAYRESRKLPYVERLFFYSLRDFSSDVRDPEANFGLLKYNGKPKPAYKAVRRVLKKGR